MLENKDYCDYDTCVALNELGCPITKWISGDVVSTFTLYEAQKWLREEKEVYVTVSPEHNEFCPVKGVKYRLEIAHWKDDEFGYETIEWLDEECPHTIITFETYEGALAEGIKEAVKILKEK